MHIADTDPSADSLSLIGVHYHPTLHRLSLTGLGFPSLSTSGIMPFWQRLMRDNTTHLDFDGFSFYFTRFINSTNATDSEFG